MGTTGTARSSVMPDVPTIAEAGVPKYEATIWLGLMAPKATPPAVVERLNAEVSRIVGAPETAKAWSAQGAAPMVMSVADFTRYVQSDIAEVGEHRPDLWSQAGAIGGRMGLLDTLNLRPPARPGTTPPASDVAVLDDEADAPRRGDGKDKKDKDDKTKLPGSEVDPRIKSVEDALNDPEKRLKALADWKIPRYAQEYDTKSPEMKVLADLESGLDAAKKYADYIAKATEYAQKFGDLSKIAEISTAAKGIKEITGKVLGPLGKVVDVVKTGKEAIQLLNELDHFADVTAAMDMKDIASVQRWVKASKSLYNAAEPFVSWAKTKAIGAAFGGSEAAAAASVAIAYVAAEFYVALQVLDAGLANEKAYFDRYKKIMKQIENGGVWASPTELPPHLPPDWESEDLKAYRAHERENQELRQRVQDTIRAERRAEQAKKDAAIAAEREKHKKEIEAAAAARDAAKRDFDEKEFPLVYLKTYRLAFRDKILAETAQDQEQGQPGRRQVVGLPDPRRPQLARYGNRRFDRHLRRPREAQHLRRRRQGRDQQLRAPRPEVPALRNRGRDRMEGARRQARRLGAAAVTRLDDR